MKKSMGILMLAAAVTMVTAPIAGAHSFVKSAPKTESRKDVEKVGLRHRHRHCHLTITLGHVKKRCHNYSHNKAVHHGINYH